MYKLYNLNIGTVYLYASDGDILKKFICSSTVKTTIYYCDEDDRARKLVNLTVILHPDTLISFVGGLNPRIEFIKI